MAANTLKPVPEQFPSMKARALKRVLRRQPLRYSVRRATSGSHETLRSAGGYPTLVWAFHDGQTLPPGLVRKILTRDIGLSGEQARALL